VTFRYGQFSHLWIDMMQRLGLDVTVIDRCGDEKLTVVVCGEGVLLWDGVIFNLT
jgi:aspartate aminotransferase-like enzyme